MEASDSTGKDRPDMTRRRFAFWFGMFLFWFSERLHARMFDTAATTIMDWSELPVFRPPTRERWKPDENTNWCWYERSTLVDGKWVTSGITAPVNKNTGQLAQGKDGYLDESLVPNYVKLYTLNLRKKLALGVSDPSRRELGGRPPSQWLRSLKADEIRLWLKTIDVPEVGVAGMTFWTHLTRDHSFSAQRIHGLTIAEQAKLHSAAHYGY